ncbi:hypothetical protein DV515_00011783 [Chloebia gouldiae]|uniref:Uncharacterized protein n=1 Tax=Chloebia gouldiae TaxID=44316 RepID=A0A3L8S6P7_CHLGU|nr:hypothetical protein DV515_00011783 [Chloebia gouldiae]
MGDGDDGDDGAVKEGDGATSCKSCRGMVAAEAGQGGRQHVGNAVAQTLMNVMPVQNSWQDWSFVQIADAQNIYILG